MYCGVTDIGIDKEKYKDWREEKWNLTGKAEGIP